MMIEPTPREFLKDCNPRIRTSGSYYMSAEDVKKISEIITYFNEKFNSENKHNLNDKTNINEKIAAWTALLQVAMKMLAPFPDAVNMLLKLQMDLVSFQRGRDTSILPLPKMANRPPADYSIIIEKGCAAAAVTLLKREGLKIAGENRSFTVGEACDYVARKIRGWKCASYGEFDGDTVRGWRKQARLQPIGRTELSKAYCFYLNQSDLSVSEMLSEPPN